MLSNSRVVFFGQPNRFYPVLLGHLMPHYKTYNIIWNHVYLYNKPYRFNFNNHTLDEVTGSYVLNARKASLVSGVLHPKYNVFFKPNFSFTVLAHPVERIYQLSRLFDTVSKFSNPYKNLLSVTNIYNAESKEPLKEFIDNLLYNNFYRDFFSDHIFLLPKNILNLVDFVGISEEENLTKRYLEYKLNIDLSTLTFNDKNKIISDYRIKEITKELEEEIEDYNSIKKNLRTNF